MKKVAAQDRLEAGNLLEEASEMLSACVHCGICRGNSAEFRALREEHVTARGKALLLRDKLLDETFFMDTMSGSCEAVCPVGIRFTEALRKAREAMVLLGKGAPVSERMVQKLREGKNPYEEEPVVAVPSDSPEAAAVEESKP